MSLLRPLDLPPIDAGRNPAGPVVLVNVVTLIQRTRRPPDLAGRRCTMTPSSISTQLHRALGESPTYLSCRLD
jgi:hypothetical protein